MESPSERLMNPQPNDIVFFITSHDEQERKILYKNLPPEYEWRNISEFGDSIPTFIMDNRK